MSEPIDWKLDGEYVTEKSGEKAEYLGRFGYQFAFRIRSCLVFLTNQEGGYFSPIGGTDRDRVIPKPKTYSTTVYVYEETAESGSLAVFTKKCPAHIGWKLLDIIELKDRPVREGL